MNQEHIMVDIETLGLNPGCVILSIAAIKFDIESGMILSTFKSNIDLESSINYGFKVEADTVMWWMRQSEEARASFQDKPSFILHALMSFQAFINPGAIIWGNSARFDLGLLAEAFKMCDLKMPWNHSNERCLRTVSSFNPEIKNNEDFIGTPHDPIDDCKHQIKYLVKTIKSLTINKLVS